MYVLGSIRNDVLEDAAYMPELAQQGIDEGCWSGDGWKELRQVVCLGLASLCTATVPHVTVGKYRCSQVLSAIHENTIAKSAGSA